MTVQELIHYLKQGDNGVIDVGLEKLTPVTRTPTGRVSKNDGYLQYKQRLPSSVPNSLHYELVQTSHPSVLNVVFHIEPGTRPLRLREIIKDELRSHIVPGVKIGSWSCACEPGVDCRDGNLQRILKEIEEKMSLLYSVVEPVVSRIEGRVAQGEFNVAKEQAEENVLPTHTVLPMVEVPKRSYPESVVEISTINDDALSWVMTIGALFRRESVLLKDGREFSFGDLVVPSYQRKYTWQKKNVRRLCRDLLGAFEAHRNTYHLGTVIFCRHGNDLEVVDGQQRLTTIARMIGRSIFPVKDKKSGDTDRQFSPEDEKQILDVLSEYETCEREKIVDILNASTVVCIAVKEISESFQLFSTQNGRGRPLSPENLLKAFHLHEYDRTVWGDKLCREEPVDKNPACSDVRKLDKTDYDTQWEFFSAQRTLREGRLLSQVFGEHLYRVRRWCRGDFPQDVFGNSKIDEFKGLTVKVNDPTRPPLQNLAVLRHLYREYSSQMVDDLFSARSQNDGMDKFVSIDQPIVNGEDFFHYAFAYANAYRTLFENENTVGGTLDPELDGFRAFYEKACICYAKAMRRGDCYARHIFESLCLFCYDKFGVEGLLVCKTDLYRCAYYERATRSRCYYSTCGSSFAMRATHKMLGCATVAEIAGELHDLGVFVTEEAGKHDMMTEDDIPAGLEIPRGIIFRKGVK